MFNRKLVYDLYSTPETKVGRRNKKNPDDEADIPLSSVGVLKEHAIFKTTDDGTTLQAAEDKACEFIHING